VLGGDHEASTAHPTAMGAHRCLRDSPRSRSARSCTSTRRSRTSTPLRRRQPPFAHRADRRGAAALAALSTRNFDSSTFTAWFTAYTLNDPQKQAVAERRFRPEFRVAFDAWMATDPFHNPRAAAGPTYMPQYKLADQAKADALDREAEAAAAAGNHAAVVGDDYVRITVFLAAVLFLVGIGSTFKLPTVRYVLIVVGAVLLVLATVLILWCCGAANAGREGSRSARPWSSRRDPGCRVPWRVPAAPLPSAPRREWAFGGGCRAPWPAWS
jgi:hypothetical protein